VTLNAAAISAAAEAFSEQLFKLAHYLRDRARHGEDAWRACANGTRVETARSCSGLTAASFLWPRVIFIQISN
jgi:hypothetical protein